MPKSKIKKTKLKKQGIKRITKICVRIEKHFKNPQDIEWVFKDKKFYIV